MGFSGLYSWGESDGAADFRYNLVEAINKSFKKELKNNGNRYNTPGWVNALLLFKEYPNLISFLEKKVLDEIDASIEIDSGYSRHPDQSLVRDYITLVVNFRETRKKLGGLIMANEKRIKDQIKETKRFLKYQKIEMDIARESGSWSAFEHHASRVEFYMNELSRLEALYKKQDEN